MRHSKHITILHIIQFDRMNYIQFTKRIHKLRTLLAFFKGKEREREKQQILLNKKRKTKKNATLPNFL